MDFRVDFWRDNILGTVALLLGYTLLSYIVVFVVFYNFIFWNPVGLMTIRATIAGLVCIFTGAYLNRRK